MALFVCSFLEHAFRHGRLVFLAFFVLATQCVLLSAHNFITQLDLVGPIDLKNLSADANQAAAAGYVLLGITNFVIIIGALLRVACARSVRRAFGRQRVCCVGGAGGRRAPGRLAAAGAAQQASVALLS